MRVAGAHRARLARTASNAGRSPLSDEVPDRPVFDGLWPTPAYQDLSTAATKSRSPARPGSSKECSSANRCAVARTLSPAKGSTPRSTDSANTSSHAAEIACGPPASTRRSRRRRRYSRTPNGVIPASKPANRSPATPRPIVLPGPGSTLAWGLPARGSGAAEAGADGAGVGLPATGGPVGGAVLLDTSGTVAT